METAWERQKNSTEHEHGNMWLGPLMSFEQTHDEVQHGADNILFDSGSESPACASPPILAHLSSRCLTNSKQV